MEVPLNCTSSSSIPLVTLLVKSTVIVDTCLVLYEIASRRIAVNIESGGVKVNFKLAGPEIELVSISPYVQPLTFKSKSLLESPTETLNMEPGSILTCT